MKRITMAAGLWLAAPCALAQPGAADPARADAPVPATRYVSPLAQFRQAQPMTQAPSAGWSAANAAVAGQGHMSHAAHGGHGARQGHEGHVMPAKPAAPPGHEDHSMHQGHAGHEKRGDTAPKEEKHEH